MRCWTLYTIRIVEYTFIMYTRLESNLRAAIGLNVSLAWFNLIIKFNFAFNRLGLIGRLVLLYVVLILFDTIFCSWTTANKILLNKQVHPPKISIFIIQCHFKYKLKKSKLKYVYTSQYCTIACYKSDFQN